MSLAKSAGLWWLSSVAGDLDYTEESTRPKVTFVMSLNAVEVMNQVVPWWFSDYRADYDQLVLMSPFSVSGAWRLSRFDSDVDGMRLCVHCHKVVKLFRTPGASVRTTPGSRPQCGPDWFGPQ